MGVAGSHMLGVADEREVQLEFLGVVLDEAEQVVGAAFLLALDHHGDGQRQLAGHRLEGAAGLDEGHHLAFVVAGAARDDDLAAVGQRRDARRRTAASPRDRADRPAARRSGRRTGRAGSCRSRAVALADHDRMTFGLTHAGFEADAAPDPWPQTRRPPDTPCCRRGRSRSTGCAEIRTAARDFGRARRRFSAARQGGLARGSCWDSGAGLCLERYQLRNKLPASKGNDPLFEKTAIQRCDRPAGPVIAARCRPGSRARWRGRPNCPSCPRATCRCPPRSGLPRGW